MKQKVFVSLVVLLLLANADFAGPISTNPAAPLAAWIVTNSVPATNDLTLDQFLGEVASANLDYAAQKYNVDIAKAAVVVAREFQNPTLNLGENHELRYAGKEINGVDQSEPESFSVGI